MEEREKERQTDRGYLRREEFGDKGLSDGRLAVFRRCQGDSDLETTKKKEVWGKKKGNQKNKKRTAKRVNHSVGKRE